MNLLGSKSRDHYRSGGSWVPHTHCWGWAEMALGHLLVINDVLAGGGDYVASCGGHDGLDRGHQPREREEGVDIRCGLPFLLFLLQSLCFGSCTPEDHSSPASAQAMLPQCRSQLSHA